MYKFLKWAYLTKFKTILFIPYTNLPVGRLTKANVEKPVELIVYNTDTQSIREITITPTDNWGGDGLIGWELFMGIKFEIPPEYEVEGKEQPHMFGDGTQEEGEVDNGTQEHKTEHGK